MNKEPVNADARAGFAAKGVAAVAVAACVAVGVVGLVLPVIPGLLFLAIAVLIAARYFPAFGARLRGHRVLARHMSRADAFCRLRLAAKIRLAGLLCLKGFLSVLSFLGGRYEVLRRR